MFGFFGQDKINLIKKNGKKILDIEYENFGKDKILIRSKLSVVKGDILEIDINGKKTKHDIINIETDFITGKKIAEYKKTSKVITTKPKSSSAGKANTNIVNHGVITQIIAGDNSKISTHSINNTTNYTLTAQDKRDFEKLIKTANQLERNKTILKNIDEMKSSAGTKSFKSKYNKFMKSIVNHVQLFSSVISFLEKFL